ncbi:MAG: stage II sporulation protein R [Oscillospiraceae bacterium]|nr:stage II sporulation protein R [Oscillospiraceae bacterium]
MKKTEISLLAAFALLAALAAFQIPFSRACEQLRGDTLRLHVVANSDSEADQAVKLAVRDAVLERAAERLTDARSAAEAAGAAELGLKELSDAANETLAAGGFSYSARARLTEMYFEERSYGEATLPAGVYTALRVELGEAEGKNWWCVVYPALCYPAAESLENKEALEAYSEEEREVVEGKKELRFKFKLEELIQSLRARREAED